MARKIVESHRLSDDTFMKGNYQPTLDLELNKGHSQLLMRKICADKFYLVFEYSISYLLLCKRCIIRDKYTL